MPASSEIKGNMEAVDGDGIEAPTRRINKRVRAGKPKARTGCRTCKVRRVKCDEAKPHCLRCQNYGTTCGGYEDLFKKRTVYLIPEETATGLPPILPKPADILFQSEKEYRYFRLFCEKIATPLDGIMSSNLWNRLVLQVGDYNPSIRHGIIAMAALDVTSQVSRIENRSSSTADIEGHHRYALQQYNLAIRNMRNALLKGDQDPTTTLITCLIVVCIETFRGNHEAAMAHTTAGVNIIGEQFSETKAFQQQKYTEGIASPVFSTVEDSLMRAFIRLDIQAMSFLQTQYNGGRKVNVHAIAAAGLSGMPTRFRSLNQARNYLELIVMYILKIADSETPHDGSSRPPPTQASRMSMDMTAPFSFTLCNFSTNTALDLNEHMAVVHTAPNLPPQFSCSMRNSGDIWLQSFPDLTPTLADQGMFYLTSIQRWHDAFHPLLMETRTHQGRANYLGATILQYQYFQTLFGLKTLPFDGIARKMEDFMPFFREIVNLGRKILKHPDLQPDGCSFTTDFLIIPGLFMVGSRCPHAGVRREAIDLLLMTPRRERLWTGVTAGRLAQKIMQLEEENIDGEYVPEDLRITQLGLSFDLKAGTAIVSGMMPRSGQMELISVKEDLGW